GAGGGAGEDTGPRGGEHQGRGGPPGSDRLSALETSTKAAAFQFKKAEGSLDTRLVHLESQLQDQGQQVGRLQVTANGENGWDSRLHHHETVLTALQSKLQSFEEYTNRIDDAVRQRWGSQIDKLEKLAEETARESSARCSSAFGLR
ncbi:unnamed protein product, partial [Prorocentrum cordatum]